VKVRPVADFHDLCLRHSRGLYRGLCRKVGVMEFGLIATHEHVGHWLI